VYAGEGVIDFTEANSEHAAIVAAAASHDLDALRDAVEQHIGTAAQRVTRLSADTAGTLATAGGEDQ
jgi:DNA-binding GntR family transcriptional regulator